MQNNLLIKVNDQKKYPKDIAMTKLNNDYRL